MKTPGNMPLAFSPPRIRRNRSGGRERVERLDPCLCRFRRRSPRHDGGLNTWFSPEDRWLWAEFLSWLVPNGKLGPNSLLRAWRALEIWFDVADRRLNLVNAPENHFKGTPHHKPKRSAFAGKLATEPVQIVHGSREWSFILEGRILVWRCEDSLGPSRMMKKTVRATLSSQELDQVFGVFGQFLS